MNNENIHDAQAILVAGQNLGKEIKTLNVGFGGAVPALLIPEGWRLDLFPATMPTPLRKTGFVYFHNLDSFIRFFCTHKTPDSVIFVDSDTTGQRGSVFTGVVNYHGGEPSFGDFRCVYAAELSPDWRKWVGGSKAPMNHEQFINHLDDCQDMIVEPAGAKLLELMRDIEGTVGGSFKSALNLHNGSASISYEENVSATNGVGKKIEVPTRLTVSIQPFDFGVRYKMENKLRYRVQNKSISFAYEAVKPELIILDAVNDQVKNVEKNCGVTPFYGNPPEICKPF